MPEVTLKPWAGEAVVEIKWPDLDSRTFTFETQKAAEEAIAFARFIQSNDISITNIKSKF